MLCWPRRFELEPRTFLSGSNLLRRAISVGHTRNVHFEKTAGPPPPPVINCLYDIILVVGDHGVRCARAAEVLRCVRAGLLSRTQFRAALLAKGLELLPVKQKERIGYTLCQRCAFAYGHAIVVHGSTVASWGGGRGACTTTYSNWTTLKLVCINNTRSIIDFMRKNGRLGGGAGERAPTLRPDRFRRR